MAEPKGRPKNLRRVHIHKVDEDTQEWLGELLGEKFLNLFSSEHQLFGTPKARVTGAAIAAAGVYTMVRLVDMFGRDLVNRIKQAYGGPIPVGGILGGPGLAVINFFIHLFGATGNEEETPPSETSFLRDLGQFDPFAFGAALTAGGMVLAGLNPGEILKGIGSIIDALIPL